jgi:hypothetical protein
VTARALAALRRDRDASSLTARNHADPDERAPDPERLKDFAKHVFGALSAR